MAGEAGRLRPPSGLEGTNAPLMEMLRARRASGTLVGEGLLARAGLSHVLFSDGGVGVGTTVVSVMDARWSAATTIGDDHHVVYRGTR